MLNSSFTKYLKVAYRFASDYFLESEERWKASLLLAASLICIILIVALTVYFSWWWVAFWGAFQAHNLAGLITSLKIFALISIAYIALETSLSYLTECIKLNWRKFLTQKVSHQYLDKTNYLELSRFSEELANPAQRIQEDIQYFVELSIDLSTHLFKSTLMQAAFIYSLWVLSGTLSVQILGLNIFIPGYLVWVALIVAISATLIKYKIGQSLKKINDAEANNESLFRSELERIPPDAENIAIEQGHRYFENALHQRFQAVYDTNYEKILVKTKLTFFDTLFLQFCEVLPYVAAAPLYFTNVIALGQLMQIGFSFSEVNQSFSWFMDRFDELAWYETNTRRLDELQIALNQDKLSQAPQNIQRTFHASSTSIILEQLSILKPIENQPIISNLSVEFKSQNHTLISGPSGMGKSTLFKAIAGSWKYGSGEIQIPDQSQIYFLAQKSTFPKATLRHILAYPKPADNYSHEQYQQVLEKINMGDLIHQLDNECEWKRILSGGQQQKISFARVLLAQPKWLFLDESTSALDEESENQMYSLIQSELPETTFISIAHRESVKKFHQRTLFFKQTHNGYLELSSSPTNII